MIGHDLLRLDRIEIEDCGPDAQKLAEAIHAQLPMQPGRVPVARIARALDIEDIRVERLQSFDGCLITDSQHNYGAILVNADVSPERQQFTIAHELLHFLDPSHQPTDDPQMFQCTRQDLGQSWRQPPAAVTRHILQERQANRFAIELLAPRHWIKAWLRGIPDLAQVVAMAQTFGISREASARRYNDLLERPTAIVFTHDNRVRYTQRDNGFPVLAVRHGDAAPVTPPAADGSGLSAHEEGDPLDWFAPGHRQPLVVQTLHQQKGYAMTLLALDEDNEC